jgi:hypothetical protein
VHDDRKDPLYMVAVALGVRGKNIDMDAILTGAK